MERRTLSRSPYMEFAKLRSAAKYTLASSGLMNFPLAELPVRLEDLEINGPDMYGYTPLRERIAGYAGVAPENVVTAAGTSMANYLAMAATLEPGDEILVERPTYELIVSTARYLGAKLRYFDRRFENDFDIDPDEVERQITERTRLVAITNLHNPSGAYIGEETLRAIGDIAERHGARVLVDEVYLEALYDERPRPAFDLGDHFLVTSSLTKAFGLSGLRCGWVLATPELAERMWHINDLHGSIPAHSAELLSVIAFDNLDKVAARGKQILERNRRALNAFLKDRTEIEFFQPQSGTIVFPKLLSGDNEKFYRTLRDRYDTSVAPGSYFDMPQHFRLGVGGDPAMTAEGLHRLGLCLDELRNN